MIARFTVRFGAPAYSVQHLRPACHRAGHRSMAIRTVQASVSADDLRSQSCGGQCGRDTPKLSSDEIEELLPALPYWAANADRTCISKRFVAKNFKAAIAFFAEVMDVAEAEGHHPDLHLTNYRDVKVDLSTHAIGGLSKNDFIVAARIDAVKTEYSPKWLRQQEERGVEGESK